MYARIPRCIILSSNLIRQATKYRKGVNNAYMSSRLFRNVNICRQFVSTSGEEGLKKITFNELQKLMKDDRVVIVDVREPQELCDYGTLPNSINIPLGEVEAALKHMPNEQFLAKYGKNKPNEQTPLVFSCMKGRRSHEAQVIATQLGYSNVKDYSGGWTEWAEKCGN